MNDDALMEVLERLASRRRDEEAWELLYRGMWPVCFAIAYRVLASRDMAEDAVIDALMRAFQQYPFSTSPNPAHFRNWVRKVTQNAAIDILRRNERADRGRDDVDTTRLPGTAPIPSERAEQRQRIQQAIEASSPTDRDIFRLVAEGYSLQEVAQILGLTVDNVGVRIHRARSRLRRGG